MEAGQYSPRLRSSMQHAMESVANIIASDLHASSQRHRHSAAGVDQAAI